MGFKGLNTLMGCVFKTLVEADCGVAHEINIIYGVILACTCF